MPEMREEDQRSTKVMHVCPKCTVCGRTSAFSLPGSQIERWQNGAYIQDAFPQLSKEEREVMISGTHAECWTELWGEDDDD